MQLGFGGMKAAKSATNDDDGPGLAPASGKAPVFEDDDDDDGALTLLAMDSTAQAPLNPIAVDCCHADYRRFFPLQNLLKEKDALGRELAAEFGAKWLAKKGLDLTLAAADAPYTQHLLGIPQH